MTARYEYRIICADGRWKWAHILRITSRKWASMERRRVNGNRYVCCGKSNHRVERRLLGPWEPVK